MTIHEIFTDGACSGNPGKGGWAFVYKTTDLNESNLLMGKYTGQCGSQEHTTNNRMELLAVIEALKFTSQLPNKEKQQILIFTDSKYLHDGLKSWITNWKKNGWLSSTKQPVKNKDLWEILDTLYTSLKRAYLVLDIQWVKGHSNNEGNQAADTLARSCAI